MAEIKSTMDLVMERAARMGKASSDELETENSRKKGMKLAAEFLDRKKTNLLEALTGFPDEQQMAIRKGMVEVLLRNIFLPKDDEAQERTRRASEGIVEIGGGAADLKTICSEMQQAMEQYRKHREQVKNQLEEQVKMQYDQLLAQQRNGMPAEGGNPELALQAQVKEEWDRLESELSGQYNQAIEQHKIMLQERLG